jgi:hypothetical protein
MLADAPDGERLHPPVLPRLADGAAVRYREPLDVPAVIASDAELPGLCGAVRRQISEQVRRARGRLSVEEPVSADAEDPEVPRVVDGLNALAAGCARRIGSSRARAGRPGVCDAQAIRHARVLHVWHQPEHHPLGDRGALFVRGRVTLRGDADLVVGSDTFSHADEREQVALTSPAGLLRADQEVHVRVFPIADPAHERYLASEIVVVRTTGSLAIEEEANGFLGGGLLCLDCSRRRQRDTDDQADRQSPERPHSPLPVCHPVGVRNTAMRSRRATSGLGRGCARISMRSPSGVGARCQVSSPRA